MLTSIQNIENSLSSPPASPESENRNPFITNRIPAIRILRPIKIVTTERMARGGNNVNDRAFQFDDTGWSSPSPPSTTSEHKASSPAQFQSAEHCAWVADESVVRIDLENVVLMKGNMGTGVECFEETEMKSSYLEAVKQLKVKLSHRDLAISRYKVQLNTYIRKGDILIKELASVKAEKDCIRMELDKLKELGNHPWHIFGIKLPRHIPNKLPELQQALETVRNMVQMLDAHRESLLAKMIEDDHQKRVCGLCFDRMRDEALIPCGHIFCSVCAMRLYTQKDQLCPYCRHRIQRTQKLFM